MLHVDAKGLARLMGQNLRRYREQRGHSIEQLSKLSGVHWATLRGAEEESRYLWPLELVKVAGVLEVAMGDLFAGWEQLVEEVRPLTEDR